MKGLSMNELTTTNIPAEVQQKIITAVELKKELERYEAEIKEEMLKVMQDLDLSFIKNDKITITRANRSTYSAEDLAQVDPELTKTVLDTTKVGKLVKLYGKTPKGVEVKNTEYLTWRVK
jgi:hypothetical protein